MNTRFDRRNRANGLLLTVGAVLFVAGTSARADIGPPVEIRMDLNEMRQAASGEQYAGVFEVQVYKAGTLASFKLLGDGWELLSLETPGDPVSVQPGVVRIPFRAVPTNADEPIGLSLTYNGRRVAKSAPVGPAHFAQAGKPYRLVPIPGTTAAVADEAEIDARREGGEGQPRGAGARDTYHFVGRIVYSRPGRDLSNPPDGDTDDPEDIPSATVGADNIDVRVRDNDTVGYEDMWSGYTDENGYFDTGEFSWEGSPTDPDPDLVLYCETEVGGVVDVTDNEWEEYTYTFQTGEIENFTGSYHDFGWYFPEPTSFHPALHIFNTVVRTRRFIQEKPAYITPEVQVEWPDDSQGGGAWYERDSVEIHISTEHQWNNATVSHEYGHHFIMSAYDPDPPSPDYCNNICDDDYPDDCGHCMWCQETDHDAWNEGFPNWLADIVTRDYPDRYTHEPSGEPFVPLYTLSQESPRTCDGAYDDPILTEGFVGALLRDIEDQTQDDHDDDPTSGTSFDGIFDLMCLGPNEIFRVTDVYQPITVTEFISAFLAENPDLTDLFWPTAYNVGGPAYVSSFPADTQPPGAVPYCNSLTHPLGDGGSLPCITFEWWPARDDVTGVSEYSFLVTDDPNGVEPDEFADPVWGTDTCGVGATVEVWALGEFYFCIKARDNAGNWSNQWAKFGPFEIIDCNGTGILDACDIDCYHLGVTNICTIPNPSPCVGEPGCGLSSDCQPNLIPDECDIANGTSEDCDLDAVPDECENVYHWQGTSGSWHVGANWLEGESPAENSHVCINVSGDETVSFSADALQVATLACSESLQIQGATNPCFFAIVLPSFVEGNLLLANANTTLWAYDRLDISGLFEWTGSGELTGAGETHANGGVEISNIVFLDGHHLILDGNSTSVCTGRVELPGDSVFEIRPGSTYEHQGGTYFLNGGSGDQFINQGTLIKSVNTGNSQIRAYTNNSGLIHVQTGTLQFCNYGSSTGDFVGEPGTTFQFVNGGFNFLAGSSVVADNVLFTTGAAGWSYVRGTWNIATATTISAGQDVTFTEEADIVSYGSSFSIPQGTANFDAPIGGPIQFDTFSIGPSSINDATANFNSGDPVEITNLTIGRGTLQGPGPVTISGLLTWNAGGGFDGTGTVNADGDVLVNTNGDQKTLSDCTFNNAATATFLGGFSRSSAVVNNLETGVMDFQADVGLGGYAQPLNNAGTMVKSAGTGTSTIQAAMNNTGTVEVQTGVLRFYTGYGGSCVQTAGQTVLNGGDLLIGPASMQISGGLLTGAGTITGNVVNTAGTVAPGLSAGTLVVVGNYTQAAAAAMKVEIGGLTQGTGFDYLDVSGSASLAGTLEVELIGAFEPSAGDTFEILTAASVTGAFDTVDLTGFPQELDPLVTYTATSVVLMVMPALKPGDMNCDGALDGLDVQPFVLAVLDPTQYGLDFPACRIDNGDINMDTYVDIADADPFVTCLLNGSSCP
ncbi:MAG: hypothetical protein JXQ75_11925 [Phycisphaerae bacterium]|nr:hypothetical protein [Phycisphaerae bacterium]